MNGIVPGSMAYFDNIERLVCKDKSTACAPQLPNNCALQHITSNVPPAIRGILRYPRSRPAEEMKVIPVSKQDLEGRSLAGLLSVERENKWPQGWSGREDHLRMDMAELAERAAQESLREYTCQIQARWPVQGWCKEDHPNKALTPCKAVGQSRWPQGW